MAMHPLVAQHLNEIRELAARYGVEKLEIFGSAMTPEFDPERSDVDFIVHYPEGYDFGYFVERLFNLERELAAAVDRPVQLVMTSALEKDSFFRNASKTRTTIYVSDKSESDVVGHQNSMPAHR